MFRWNIAKSAEAMLSRWAIKRLCKFLLKKKLGKFILGDIDLNQLDVQLSAGTIQLSDLALNVDYLNQKFGAVAGVNVKEGSIGSLLVTMPWKGDGCRIDVDELELVLSPCGENVSEDANEACSAGRDESQTDRPDSGKHDCDGVNNAVKSNTFDVHEGVKTVAKMVKWLLTSFHVEVKKLIVAFDPCIEEEKRKGFCRTLVLRIAELECGTRISDDSYLKCEATADNFLGLSYLTNFVKFQGAILEFLQLDGVDNQIPPLDASGTSFGQWMSRCCPFDSVTPIITSKKGGFSGNLKISIPWKNGSLDIRKVDADAHIDPLELRCQPSTIKGFICLWDIFKNMNKKSETHILNDVTESVFYSSASNCDSSTPVSCMLASNKSQPDYGSPISECSALVEKELASDALLSESHLISDWVTGSQKERIEEEPDFGASVHQFFECFDGLRSSQSALGNSGVWNWTSSVFSAITAASDLASGSLHIPSEQEHIETNFKATVAEISLLFSFIDDDQMHTCVNENTKLSVHYVDAKFDSILLVLQVCPREMSFEAKVEHIEVADCFSWKNEILELNFQSHNDAIRSQVASIQNLRSGIHGVLPSFCSFKSKTVIEDCTRNFEGIYRQDVVKVPLLETSGATQCQVHVSSGSSSDLLMGPTSFSLKLPHFIFWVNIDFLSVVLDLLKEMISFYQTNSTRTGSVEATDGNYKCSAQGDERKCSSHVASSSRKETPRGDIFFLNARIIVCFPSEKCGYFRSYSSCRQFIAFDFSIPATSGNEKFEASKPRSFSSFKQRNPLAILRSLHLNLGHVDAYFITFASEENAGGESCGEWKMKFIPQKFLSIVDGAGINFPIISMFWQEDSLTGPWIAKRAKFLASAENIKSRDAFNGKGLEFASVTTVKDMEDFYTRTRQEMISSSKTFVRAHLPPVTVNLSISTYENLLYLLQQVIDCFSCMTSDTVDTTKEPVLSQESVLVECDSIAISVTMEAVESVKGSMQSELPGSWHSLRLKVQNFELLSVSAIGGIRNGSFLWVSHGEGDLWGSVTGVPGQEFVLITCSDSAVGRGSGEGSNVLSSKLSGSEIIHLWDPESFHSYTSIVVRSGTVVAIGGRLDWLGAVCSLFSSSSTPNQEADEKKLQKDSETSIPSGSSFVLYLVDIALSYEPYLNNLVIHGGTDTGFCCGDVCGTIHDPHVACLLAASSLCMSNTTTAGSLPAVYRISVHDLGLLLSVVPGANKRIGPYGIEHLRKTGYVKVAQEAHVEALLKTNFQNGCMWEVECLDSQIVVSTCHDTTSGLIRLAAQLQQIFAPDMEESAVHLQNRWDIIQRAQETDDNNVFNDGCAPSISHMQTSGVDSRSNPIRGNLMDEICEDAFHLSGNCDGQAETSDLHLRFALSDSYLDKPYGIDVGSSYNFAGEFPFEGSVPPIGAENSATSLSQESFPKIIEEHFLSDLRPLSTLTSQPSIEVLKCDTESMVSGDLGRGNSGWYRNSSLRILDNHISEANSETNMRCSDDWEASSNGIVTDSFGKVKGRILLKNMNVLWRMFGGSDWHSFSKTVQHSASNNGRDMNTCIELTLSGLEFKYDIFPDGGMSVSKLSLAVQDFCLNDNSDNAAWKLVLGYYQSKNHPRRSSSKAFKLELESIRPDPLTPLEEYRLRVAFLPMRLHLHQSQLDFLINFFGGEGTSGNASGNANKEFSESGNLSTSTVNLGGHTIMEAALLPYFQKFDISPVLIRVDYSPCRFDLAALRGGKYVELVNLVPWKGIELQLKGVQAVGIYGWNGVCERVIGEWLEDISQNQVHKLLKGLPPIRSLVAVGSGAAKLVTLPVKNYRKDQRLVKGMQRGTIAFMRSISVEAIGLGVHLAAGAHEILLQAECLLTTIPPSVPWPPRGRVNTNVRSNQPKGARQGIQQAYESISEGLSKSASALVQTPLKKYQRGGGVGSALVTAVQAAPAAAIAPASATARAVHCALLGVRNSLDPEHKKESLHKYLGTSQYQRFMQ